MLEQWLLTGSVLLIVSVVASKTSGRTGVPALLLFLLIGILAGSEGLGGIYFDNAHVAQSVGVVALVYILFSGGLDTDVVPLKSVALGGLLLSTVGVAVTASAVAAFAYFILRFEWLEAFLLGSIISSTDAAAVFTVMRSKGLGLKKRIKPLLELESGSNDPMAVILTVTFISLMTSASLSLSSIITNFLVQIVLGLLFGLGFGRLSTWCLNKIQLEFEGLYPVLTVSIVALTFSVSQFFGGNGFLSVYLLGLVLAQSKFVHKRSLVIFHDGVAWLCQIVMFLCLGLLVFPSQLPSLLIPGLLLAGFLIFVARPIAVFMSLIKQGYTAGEKCFVSWVGLRGSVPIILATYPMVAHVEKANIIFNLVFFVVVVSVAFQGTTLMQMANIFKVNSDEKPRARYPIEFIPDMKSRNDLIEIEVGVASPYVGQKIVNLQLPKSTLIVLMQRGGETFVPNGSTIVQAGDSMLLLADATHLESLKLMLQS